MFKICVNESFNTVVDIIKCKCNDITFMIVKGDKLLSSPNNYLLNINDILLILNNKETELVKYVDKDNKLHVVKSLIDIKNNIHSLFFNTDYIINENDKCYLINYDRSYNYQHMVQILPYSSDMSLVIDNKLPDNNLINDKHDDVDNDEVDNKNNNSHSEGTKITALGGYFYTEDSDTEASGDYSHAEGSNTTASGKYSHAEGYATTASGYFSHSEGSNTTASGIFSHAEGYKSTASGISSHADGDYSHAEGYASTASGSFSHGEGFNTFAKGNVSHAEGINTIAKGQCSHAGGYYTIADYDNMTAIGKYNVSNDEELITIRKNKLFVVGNGNEENRMDAFIITEKGDVFIQHNLHIDNDLIIKGDLYVNGVIHCKKILEDVK